MRAALLSYWTLFFGILLFMAGNGLQGALLGNRAETLAFGDLTTGVVISCYFAGFMVGSVYVPKLVNAVGHVRIFGALAGMASSSILIHAVFENAPVWMLMRLVTGFAYSGMYIIAESWLNDKATNETRGTLLSAYMIVTMLGLIIGLLLLGVGDPATPELFIIVSVFVSVAVIPILMTAASVPEIQEPEPTSIARVFRTSPLAVIGIALHGTTASMAFGMSAVYATKLGFSLPQISFYIAAIMLGALILQYPIGRMSDRIDRRTVILVVQILAVITAMIAFFVEGMSFYIVLGAAALYGGIHTPLYSLYIAHANDYLSPRQIVATSSRLVMINGVGAVFGAPIVGYMMGQFSASAYFPTMAFFHAIVTCVVAYRMFSRKATPTEAQAPFVVLPTRGSAIATTLLPEAEWVDDEDDDKENSLTN